MEQHFRAPCPRDHASWPRIDFEQKIAGAPCNLDLVSVLIKTYPLILKKKKYYVQFLKPLVETPLFFIFSDKVV